jgi:negative regulator of sigma E activity
MEMDCIRTQATLSAVHDGEHVTDDNAEAARAHVAGCDRCGAFQSDLRALQALPAPQAPPGLVDRIMVAVAAVAAERAEDEQALLPRQQTAAPVDSEASTPRFEWFTGRARWGAIGALATAAVAVIVIAVLVSRPSAPQTAATGETAATGAGALDLTYSNQESAKSAPSAPAATPAPARAPDYLKFNSRVYSPGSLLSASTIATQQVGTVGTAFGGAGAPTQAPAYRSPVTDGSIVVAGPDGSRIYGPVVRMFAGVKYQLVAGNALERFGLWPELPARFPVPTSPDGSPTFVVGGGDALGVQTFTAGGIPPTQGFAIAPGTPASDPAGSNPNWTWWEPLLIP